eukprot:2544476-Pleurochrysis_carterae.AAC.1
MAHVPPRSSTICGCHVRSCHNNTSFRFSRWRSGARRAASSHAFPRESGGAARLPCGQGRLVQRRDDGRVLCAARRVQAAAGLLAPLHDAVRAV